MMDIEEIYKKYYKAKKECDMYDEIDRSIDDEEYALIKQYEKYPNHGIGDYDFIGKLKEIRERSADNYNKYVEASKTFKKMKEALMNAIDVKE